MTISPIGRILVKVTGARGIQGESSGPLGVNSVGANQISSSTTELQGIVNKLALPIIVVDLHPSLRAAYDALPATGGTLLLGNKRYRSPFTTLTGTGSTAVPNVDYLAKPNVRLVGVGRPQLNGTRTRYVDGSGTIIEDSFFCWADNLTIEGIGFDSGADFCFANYGGTAREALFAGFKPGQVAWNEGTSPNKRGLTLRNVGALCKEAGAPVHGILMEAIDGINADDLETTFGTHGTVIKSRFALVSNVRSFGNNGEGVICKGNTYAPMAHVNLVNIEVRRVASGAPNDGGRGVQIYNENAAGVGKVNVTNLYTEGKAIAVEFLGSGVADCIITGLNAEGCDTGVSWNGDVRRCRVNGAVINNSSQAAVCIGANDLSNSLTDAAITNVSSTSAINIGDGKLSVDNLHFEGVTAAGSVCIRVGANGRARIGKLTAKNGTILGFMNSTPNLLNGWTLTGGGTNPFFVLMLDGRITFFGTITKGTSDTFATLPAWLRPSADTYIAVGIYNGSTDVTGRMIVQTNGDCRIVGMSALGAGAFAYLDGASFGDALVAA
jgi:hypothetical protein